PLTPDCPRRLQALAPRRSLAWPVPVPPVLFPPRAAVRWIHPTGTALEPPVRLAPGPGAAGPAVVPWSPPHPAGGLASFLTRRPARILPPGHPQAVPRPEPPRCAAPAGAARPWRSSAGLLLPWPCARRPAGCHRPRLPASVAPGVPDTD